MHESEVSIESLPRFARTSPERAHFAQAVIGWLGHSDVDHVNAHAAEFRELLLEPSRLFLGPGAAGEVGEDVDFLSIEAALPQEFHRGVDRGRKRLRVADSRQIGDAVLGRAAIGLKCPARSDLRIDHGDFALFGQLRQQPLAEIARDLDAGIVFVAIFHARRSVEDQRRGDRGLLAAGGGAEFHARPGQCEGQQRDDSRPQQQQQQMPQPQSPPVHVGALLNEPQRRELQQRRLAPHDQMQHDRHRDQRRSGQE